MKGEKDDWGRLLIPIGEVERNILNRSLRITFEIPDLLMIGSREEVEDYLREQLQRVGDRLMDAWDKHYTR